MEEEPLMHGQHLESPGVATAGIDTASGDRDDDDEPQRGLWGPAIDAIVRARTSALSARHVARERARVSSKADVERGASGDIVDVRSSSSEENTDAFGEPLVESSRLSTSPSTSPGEGAGDDFEVRRLPWQRQARRFYGWLPLVAVLSLSLLLAAPIALFLNADRVLRAMSRISPPIFVGIWIVSLLSVVATYVYHFLRLRGSEGLPHDSFRGSPLTHVVIVCSYKEPMEVLARTFESIAGQRGLRRPLIAVFAAEAADRTWRDSFQELEGICAGRIGEFLSTEHVLLEGEVAGKSANENWAAREVYRQLVDMRGMDPFGVMVTIVDADSVLSDTYLAHVEAAFWEQPDGRRLLYNGPLNVYRNFAEAGLLVQSLELARCHQDMFHGIFAVPHPYSNYSLTLGFASEVGFWTPDVMPEDIHTMNKAMAINFGSRSSVTIPALICNDLVPSIGDRYAQAKRHQYGSVTEFAWTLALFTDSQLRFLAWWAVFTAEAGRPGSFLGTVGCLAATVSEALLAVVVARHWDDLPPNAGLCLALMGSYGVWQWLWFWIAELSAWRGLLHQFQAERPSLLNWVCLLVLMPTLHLVNRVVFLLVPTAHALLHAAVVGELAYVCAPKGQRAIE